MEISREGIYFRSLSFLCLIVEFISLGNVEHRGLTLFIFSHCSLCLCGSIRFICFRRMLSVFLVRHRKYKFLGAKKMRFYEPQRHNAANAAHKGVHEKINKTPLCPLRLCGSIRFSVFLVLLETFLPKRVCFALIMRYNKIYGYFNK